MEKLSFDTFTKKINIKASMDKLYWCWASEEGICSWFLSSAKYLSPSGNTRDPKETIRGGDTYIWEWYNWSGKESGTILKANGKDSLEFSFADDSCKVLVSMEKKDNSVLVTLKQYDMPTDEETKMNIYNGCSCGWTFWLANLKAYLEHGILLNEKEYDLTAIPQAGHINVNM